MTPQQDVALMNALYGDGARKTNVWDAIDRIQAKSQQVAMVLRRKSAKSMASPFPTKAGENPAHHNNVMHAMMSNNTAAVLGTPRPGTWIGLPGTGAWRRSAGADDVLVAA